MAIKLLRKDLPNKSSALLIFLPYRMVQSERLIASLHRPSLIKPSLKTNLLLPIFTATQIP